MNRSLLSGVLLLIGGLFALVAGCEDDPVAPPRDGSITVAPTPEQLSAPWLLTGPEDLAVQGHGAWQSDNMKPGEYNVSWGHVSGWYSPPAVFKSLSAGGSISFSGEYLERSGLGTIVIDAVQDSLDATWQLTGPGSFYRSGNRDAVFSALPVGSYQVEWGIVPDWVAPMPRDIELEPDDVVIVSGIYREAIGTIVISPDPASIDVHWVLVGPGSISSEGSGATEIQDARGGYYTLVWRPAQGWITPRHMFFYLQDGEREVVSGSYVPLIPAKTVTIPPEEVGLPATFTMGSEYQSDETPHDVTLTRAFEMAETELTIGQFVDVLQWAYDNGHVRIDGNRVHSTLDGSTDLLTVMASDILFDSDHGVFTLLYGSAAANRPAVGFSWYGAAAYCDWLSLREGLPRSYDHGTWICNDGDPYSAVGYRLPTEAEWEFACRAGTTTHFNTGDCIDGPGEANFRATLQFNDCPTGQSSGYPKLVKSHPPNGWGLYEMHGNVREWCNDWYGQYGGPEVDPIGAAIGATQRVVRGGFYGDYATDIRSARRVPKEPLYSFGCGVRPVRTVQ